MPVSGTALIKMLPNRKGCKDCGFPTCFAFAMKLASGGTTVDKCPYLDEDTKAKINDLLAPPQKLVTVGSGDNKYEIGNEEVVYRHDKTFVHEPAIALLVSDKENDEEIERKIKKIQEVHYPWVGLTLHADLLAPHFESGDKTKFLALVKRLCDSTNAGMVLISEDTDVLFAARDICGDRNPLIYPITKENIDIAIPKLKEKPTAIGIRAEGVEQLIPLTTKLKDAGLDHLVMDPGSKGIIEALRDQTFIRRAALKTGFKALGYPTIAFPCFINKDGLKEMLAASMFVDKYAGIIVLSDLNPNYMLPLLVQRLNIYTDPRFPMSVEQKYYEIGQPTEESPVLMTSNWSLTYFVVASAIEATKVPCFLLVQDAEGLGVLTGWAAGKISGDTVGKLVRTCGIEERVKHRQLVIPGRIARISGETMDALDWKWEVTVGPRESTAIGAFLPKYAKELKEKIAAGKGIPAEVENE
jgi:acetyl-CoA decarbonylase/synthase, CODH/ACS complex subunit gamma